MADEIWRWDGTRMAEAIARREISSREAVASCLTRMAEVNPRLNAVTVDLGEEARAAADRADQAVSNGGALGPLHGVPVTIKENVDQAGCATTNGVVAFRNLIAQEDSPVVANWTAAGAVILGRTNTPAFSFRLDTDNDLRGRTWNPWSAEHTPGGSSGGAAASVAAGITPLAHGNDIAGSIRYPAYACGLVGLRPSFGRVPAFNPSAGAERSISAQLLSVQGPLARTVRDVRLGLAAMATRDARDPWWVPAPLEGEPIPGRRQVAVVTEPEDLAGARLHRSVTDALHRAAGWLADAGYDIVDERTPGFTRAMELWSAMQMPEIRLFFDPVVQEHGDAGIKRAMALWMAGHPAVDGAAYMKALAERARRGPRVAALPGTRAARAGPGLHGTRVHVAASTSRAWSEPPSVWQECATLTAVPVLGLPALAVPTGVVDGLPMGVQIIGARFREDLCLSAGEAIEARSGMAAHLPTDIRW